MSGLIIVLGFVGRIFVYSAVCQYMATAALILSVNWLVGAAALRKLHVDLRLVAYRNLNGSVGFEVFMYFCMT